MSDFRIYENQSATSENYPFLIDVQSELLSALDTRLVIPLMRSEAMGRKPIRNLNPPVRVNGSQYFAITQQMAAIPKAILGGVMGEIEFSRLEILNSIDFLVTGI
jgi:toxin CcdB